MVRESRELHRPWTYPPERPDQFDDLVAAHGRDDFVCLPACCADDGDLVGIFTISQIVRGYFQSAYLGYYASARHAGKGLMREAMAARARPRVRRRSRCTGSRRTSSPATRPRSRSRAAPASGWRATRRATC